jgi:hypothetical protein
MRALENGEGDRLAAFCFTNEAPATSEIYARQKSIDKTRPLGLILIYD